MKISVFFFFFLIQSLFISALAMNETPIPADSSSSGKSLVIFLDGKEIFGEITSQTDDSVNIKNEKNTVIRIPLKQLSCIINLTDNYNPNIWNRSNNKFLFTLPDERFEFGQIISSDGFEYKVKLDDSTITYIDSYSFLTYNFPAYLIKSIKWLNSVNNQYYRIYLEDLGQLDCQIISLGTENMKIVAKSKYLVTIQSNLFTWNIKLKKISDTTKLSFLPHIVILRNDCIIKGMILSRTKDSVLMKVGPGLALQVSNREIDGIYPKDYFAKNVLYIDAASIIFVGYISANYDFMLNSFISIRLGAGLGYEISFSSSSGYYKGGTCMFNFLPGGINSKFEFGIGLSYVMEDREYYQSKYNDKVSAAFAIGYRYQNKYEGMLFRIGIGSLGYGGGLYLSLGYAF